MKMNEVCKRTNLTERTIRFYIEKGLLHTKSQIINGRINRDFTEDDVEILKDISKLRKAGFSIPDILDMQNDNRNVQVIVLQHYNKLKDESELRESLVNDLREIQSRGDISWRKCASLLFNEKESSLPKTICYPLDGVEFKEVGHTDKKKRKKQKATWIAVILLIFSMIGILFYSKYHSYARTVTFIVEDIVIDDKWYDEKESQYYLSVYSTNPSIDHGYYFESPSTLKIDNEILFHSLLIDSEPYLSTLICIEIPAEDMLAHNWDILNMEFLIQTILENPNFISKYCVVKQIQAM